MTPRAFERWMDGQGWHRREAGRQLGISQDRLRRYARGEVKIPRSIELSCVALETMPSLQLKLKQK